MFAEFVVGGRRLMLYRGLFSTGMGGGHAKGMGDCSTIILISCAERLHATLIASRGIFNKYFIRCSIITA